MAAATVSGRNSPLMSSSLGADPEIPVNQPEQTRLQILWEKTVDQPTTPVRYQRVDVLMLSWDDTCDDLKTKQEVDALAAVFKDVYHFEVQKQKLNHNERAQAQMNHHLATFVRWCEKMGNTTLMIIYYAGHGWSDGACSRSRSARNRLRLAGMTHQQAVEEQFERNSVMWERAESNIEGADADVFLIFDCCNAGLISRSGGQRKFEAFGACAPNAITNPPGEDSFTSALIRVLKKLGTRTEKPYFPSSELRQMITEDPLFPKNQHPVLTARVPHPDYIVIAPLGAHNQPPGISPDQKEDRNRARQASYLDLRFHCHKLNDEIMIKIATSLTKMLRSSDLPAHRIDFLGKDAMWRLAQRKRWYKTLDELRRRSSLESPRPSLLIPKPPTPELTSAVTSDGGAERMLSVTPNDTSPSTPRLPQSPEHTKPRRTKDRPTSTKAHKHGTNRVSKRISGKRKKVS